MEQKAAQVISNELPITEADPSPNTKKYKSILFEEFLIIFPHYTSYKKTPELQIFNLKTQTWSTTTLEQAPEILEHSEGYSLTKISENSFILYGAYKAYISQPNAGLFGPPPKIVEGVALGNIKVNREGDKIKLVYERINDEKAPRVHSHSASFCGTRLWIFGGKTLQDDCVNTIHIYIVDSNTWDAPPKPTNLFVIAVKPSARFKHSSLIYKDFLYVFGGSTRNSEVLLDLWRFDLKTLSWEKIPHTFADAPPVTTRTASFYAAVYENNLIFGSADVTPYTIDFFVFETNEQNTVSRPTKSSVPIGASAGHTFEVYDNKLILGNGSSFYNLTLGAAPSSPIKTAPVQTAQVAQPKARAAPETYEEQMRRHFQEKPFADITFKVQGTDIKAHKGFIAIRCPYFQRMFSSGMKEAQSTEIEISDISPAAFNTVLEWIYCDQVNSMSDKTAEEIFAVADKFSLPELKKIAEKCLVDHLTVENVVERAELSDIFEATSLEQAAVKFIVNNIDAVFEKSDIRRLPDPILLKVCKGGK